MVAAQGDDPSGDSLKAEMADRPINGRATLARQLRGCLAVWFAALLAIAPIAQPSLPLAAGAAPAAVQSLAAHDHAATDASGPAARLRLAQLVGLGVLSRPSSPETTLGPAPATSTLHWPGANDGWSVAGDAAGAPEGATRAVFQRSSVGTARTPTGPPA